MLRIKHKSISEQFFILFTLYLCSGLTMLHWLTVGHAAELPQQPYYVVDAYRTPGAVYRIVNRKPDIFFKRRLGNISSIAICSGQLYFCSINDKRIYQRMGQEERVVFEHGAYIRDIAVDMNGNLYFSEARGGKGDGRIYQLSPTVSELGREGKFSISKETIPVYLKTVNGFWAGDFTFDERGNLYLSTGDRSPAFIYKAQRDKGGQYGSPRSVYKDTQAPIKGIAMDPTNPNLAYYADWGRAIYKLDVRNLRRSVEFSGDVARSKNPHLSDVAFDIRIRSKK
jgi:hypothetical protein